jgi:glucokinase
MSRQLIGIDVGGTKLSVASLQAGRLGAHPDIPTSATSTEALMKELENAINELRSAATAAVGVGVPSVVEFATGRVKSSVNVSLADVALKTMLTDRLGLPVFVDNDANCAALAEAYDDDGIEMIVRDLVMFTVGTGVGGGLVLGGRLYRGATGAAGELGHTLVGANLESGAPDSGRFPQPGSLESLASGRALDALAAAHGYDRGPAVLAAAREGDTAAGSLLALLGQRLGIGIANAINTFDPDVVVIGGGVSGAGELLLGPARESALRFVLPGVGEATEIRLARFGAEAGVRGAALLAAHELDAAA